ncbi:NAD(P)H-binding protein [Companilactobacillus sp. DQM5]|uniref:NAD(P)H-binding protein n=1 Tax=Companilactobacillus sp. DQM5 TaxID=3463359 RepID=UPI004058391C
MKKILVLGANGKIARLAEQEFLERTDFSLTLFLRNSQRLNNMLSNRVTLFEGDASSKDDLRKVMEENNVKRLIWISTLGIYDEVPGKFGEWNNATLGSYITNYRSAADVVENSGLDYTVIRPAWLTNNDEIEYEITTKNEKFKGTEVSRRSIADIVVKISQDESFYNKESIGVNKPNTDGDKPSWY